MIYWVYILVFWKINIIINFAIKMVLQRIYNLLSTNTSKGYFLTCWNYSILLDSCFIQPMIKQINFYGYMESALNQTPLWIVANIMASQIVEQVVHHYFVNFFITLLQRCSPELRHLCKKIYKVLTRHGINRVFMLLNLCFEVAWCWDMVKERVCR